MTDEGAIRADERINSNLHLIFPVLLGFLALGPLVFAYQAIRWLQTDVWTPIPVGAVVGPMPQTTWAGLQRLLNWFMELEIGWALLALAGLTLWRALTWMDRISDQARAARLNRADRERSTRQQV